MLSRTHSISQLNTTTSAQADSAANFPLPGDGRGVLVTRVGNDAGAFSLSHSSLGGSLATDDASEPCLCYQQRRAAVLLDVSLATMRRLIADGLIKTVRIEPKIVLVPREELTRFVRENANAMGSLRAEKRRGRGGVR
jgi:hypothetical protein